MKNSIMLAAAVLICSACTVDSQNSHQQNFPVVYTLAEKSINMTSIRPIVRTEPFPSSGKVAVNAPWFLWSPVIKKKQGYNSYSYDPAYQYKGRLSMDSNFNNDTTYYSETRDWTFFKSS